MLSPTNRNVRIGGVFLSFRGEQVRHGFVSHLIDAFERHGITFFVDKYEQRGKDLSNLFLKIEQANVALAIFSSRYGDSSWCMDELVKMKKRVDEGKLQVIPIFYKVRARDVSGQTGEFGEKFWDLAKASRGGQIMEWKEALECICNKMGLSLGENSSEADFIKEIVQEVEKVLATSACEDTKDHHCIKSIQNKKGKMLYQKKKKEKDNHLFPISPICKKSKVKTESQEHRLFSCQFSSKIWQPLASRFVPSLPSRLSKAPLWILQSKSSASFSSNHHPQAPAIVRLLPHLARTELQTLHKHVVLSTCNPLAH